MNNLFKRLTVFVLVFSFLVSPLSVFGYSIDVDNDFHNSFDEEQIYNINSDTYDLLDTYDLTEEHIQILNLYGISVDENESSMAIAQITVATIKVALNAIGRSSAFISLTTHALQRFNERVFTSNIVARLMSNGTKYTDIKGSKILYDASSKTALILDKAGKVVVTALDSVNLKQKMTSELSKWVLRNW